jgi:hypothetical protein
MTTYDHVRPGADSPVVMYRSAGLIKLLAAQAARDAALRDEDAALHEQWLIDREALLGASTGVPGYTRVAGMPTHKVEIKLTISMEDMDGTPEQSAEIAIEELEGHITANTAWEYDFDVLSAVEAEDD